MTNVNRTDSEEYRCVANNRVGYETSNPATLDVQCKYIDFCQVPSSSLLGLQKESSFGLSTVPIVSIKIITPLRTSQYTCSCEFDN